MSNEAQAIALHHSRARNATIKLVLIGIANHDGDGGAWPSVRTLADYAVTSDRTVQRAVDELERLGEIRKVVQGGGTRHTADYARPNLYEFLLRCPPDCDGTKNHRTRRTRSAVVELDGLSTPLADRVTPVSPGDTGVTGGVTPVSPEPVPETRPSRTADYVQTAHERASTIEHAGWTHPCVDGRTDTHQPSKRTGACAFCAATRTHWQETL